MDRGTLLLVALALLTAASVVVGVAGIRISRGRNEEPSGDDEENPG
ncbi:MAG: hypothetical protein MUP92_02980 [Actinobacteria bacterium]|nr:hypothetical protein [Actinomycetota bacterium]